jgi:hypothetical protein
VFAYVWRLDTKVITSSSQVYEGKASGEDCARACVCVYVYVCVFVRIFQFQNRRTDFDNV